MKKNVIWVMLSVLTSIFLLLTSCAPEATPTPTASTPTPTQTTSTPTAEAHWWDKFGEPEYGGTITLGNTRGITNVFDSYQSFNTNYNYYMEPLWIMDPTADRTTEVNLTTDWVPYSHWTGNLVEDWEWSDPQTMVVHLRQDVYWQDKEPVNGRQFTADDVVFHYDRFLGTGSGFTEPNPYGRLGSMQQVTAQDEFTVVYTFGKASIFANSEALINQPAYQFFESPEVFAMGLESEDADPHGLNSALNDWHNAVGTGPFILSDFVSDSVVRYVKNPNYFCYDERFPQNRLPYADELTVVYTADTSTQLAALRTGKIDIMESIDWQQAESLQRTNPELLYGPEVSPGPFLQLRCDMEPFSDINVRKALQMAVDLQTIAEGYYGGTVDWKPVGFINPNTAEGFTVPYDDWPADLQAEFNYDPEKAKELLAAAGYPTGFSVKCDAGPMSDLAALQAIQSYFTDINVTMEIEPYDMGAMQSLVATKKHDEIVAQTVAICMPPLMGMQMYTSYEPTSALCHSDLTFDQMVEDCGTTPNTIEEAQKLVSDTDMYFIQQHWGVTTFPLTVYIFWQPYLKGYDGEKVFMNGIAPYFARDWIDQELKASMGR